MLSMAVLLLCLAGYSQNVGISRPNPSEKLHVDSGSIKIGNAVWSGSNIPFLKFGDDNFVTIGEEEGDDKLTIRAKELFIRPGSSYPGVPVSIQGSTQYSHFYSGSNEDTYIRGGKAGSNVNIGDIGGGRVGIGMSNPTRAALEQQGSVSATAAIFGGDGTGISLQKNWPAIGFNSYLDGAGHKSINQGYGAQLVLNQVNGTLSLNSFPFLALPNQVFPSATQRFNISRFGKIGLGTDNPYSDMEIIQRPLSSITYDDDSDIGITYKATIFTVVGTDNVNWNTHVGYGKFNSSFYYYDNYAFWRQNGSNPWEILANISSTSGAFFQLSDKDVKKDIVYLGNNSMLQKIMQLKPASYRFKKEPPGYPLSYGFIAQDLEQLFPGSVLSTKTNKLVSYSYFIPLLTKGMQEQQQQIDQLAAENASLKERLARLEKAIAERK